jgi:hypothetical protein
MDYVMRDLISRAHPPTLRATMPRHLVSPFLLEDSAKNRRARTRRFMEWIFLEFDDGRLARFDLPSYMKHRDFPLAPCNLSAEALDGPGDTPRF